MERLEERTTGFSKQLIFGADEENMERSFQVLRY